MPVAALDRPERPSEEVISVSSEGDETLEHARKVVPKNVPVINLTTGDDDEDMTKSSDPVVKD